jgi:ribokinase
MSKAIVVVGSLNMDLVVRAPRQPTPGETILGGPFHTIPGGKGANQAVAIARLGYPVVMVGRVGADAFGQALLENMAAVGADTTWVRRDAEAASGVALIIVDDAGQNSIVVASGANMRLTEADVEAARETIAAAAALVLQLESPLPTVAHAVGLAHEHGVPVILNPAPARPLGAELLKQVDYLIPNENETTLLTDIKVSDDASAKLGAEKLLAAGVGTAVITLGERGALLAGERERLLLPAYQVTVVDTTAAGDAFVGAFAVALAEGRPLREATKMAMAAGALAVTKMGAQPAMPNRAELDAFLNSQHENFTAKAQRTPREPNF